MLPEHRADPNLWLHACCCCLSVCQARSRRPMWGARTSSSTSTAHVGAGGRKRGGALLLRLLPPLLTAALCCVWSCRGYALLNPSVRGAFGGEVRPYSDLVNETRDQAVTKLLQLARVRQTTQAGRQARSVDSLQTSSTQAGGEGLEGTGGLIKTTAVLARTLYYAGRPAGKQASRPTEAGCGDWGSCQ